MHIFLTIAILVTSIYANIFTNKEQSDAAKYMNALKDLIISTQRTRGVTNAYLNGNHAAIVIVYSHREDMKKAMGKMKVLELSSDSVINDRATALNLSLVQLNHEALEIKAKESFDRYSESIAQALMLAQTVSKKSVKNLNDFTKTASHVMLEIILPLSESIGQLRGYGSGVAAKQKLTSKDKHRVNALLAEITILNTKLNQEINSISHKYQDKYDVNLENEFIKTNKILKGFMKLTKKELFATNISIDSLDYFDKGTAAVDKIIYLFDVSSKAIDADSKGWF